MTEHITTRASDVSDLEGNIVLKSIQLELTNKAVLAPLCNDVSGWMIPGTKTIEFPSASSLTMGAFVDGYETEAERLTLTTEVLTIDTFKHRPVKINDKAKAFVNQDLGAIAVQRLVSAFVRTLEASLLVAIKDVSSSAPDNILQLTGTSNLILTLADIRTAKYMLDKAYVPTEGRVILVSAKQESTLLGLSDFIDAAKFGSNEPIMNGQIGKIYGMPVIVVPGAEDAFMWVGNPKAAVAYAYAQSPKIEFDRNIEALDDIYSLSCFYGCKHIADGQMGIYFNSTGA